MKIIGMQDDYYIGVVSHHELEKCLDRHYGAKELLAKLRVGNEIDVGAGYDFRENIKSAVHGMEQASERFERAQATLLKFSLLVRNLPDPPLTGETK